MWQQDTPLLLGCRDLRCDPIPLIQQGETIIFAPVYQEKSMSQNLALLSQEEKDKVNVDLAAAGVAFKERYNMPVIAEMVEREQPEALRDWFRQRLMHYRQASLSLSRLPYEPKQK